MSRAEVKPERLTDGSRVYSVHVKSEDGPVVVFAAVSSGDAIALADAINSGTVDCSIRDGVKS